MQTSFTDFNDELNQTISREGTHAEKYELRQALFGTEDVLPMWVADMDLPTPAFILDALKERLQHPLLGYTITPEPVYQAIIDWQAHNDYHITKSQIVFTHNVANGFHMAVSAFTQPGDAVLVQPPIYPPFLQAPTQNNRRLVEAPLVLDRTQSTLRYEIDFIAFEQAIINHQVKLFLFCNPQNPSGRVWLKTELKQLAELCLKHGVTIVSDEIHSDLIYPGHQHLPIASLSPEIANITVTLNSPGKTFNLGGLQIGYAIIDNPKLKADYLKVCQSISIHELNLMGLVALQAAYSVQGFTWKQALLNYLTHNIERVESFFKQHYPLVRVMRPEASYLIWIDFSAMFTNQNELKNWLINKAKLGLSDGLSFGEAGKGFMRMNIAVNKAVLEQVLLQLEAAK
jgi:cystathionine beta-lyase